MLATFSDTIKSLREPGWGQQVITRRLRSVFWYWFKYILILTFLPLLAIIPALTYNVPRLPKVIQESVGVDKLSFASGRLSIEPSRSFTVQDGDFLFIFDPLGQTANLDTATSGALLLPDRLLVKRVDGQVTTQSFAEIPDFSLTKTQVIDWLQNHRFQVYAVALAASLLLLVFASLVSSVFRLGLYLVWSFGLILISRRRHTPLVFRDAFKLSLAAGVPAVLLSGLASLFSAGLSNLLELLVLGYLTLTWLFNLSKPTPTPPVTSPHSPVRTSKRRSTRK